MPYIHNLNPILLSIGPIEIRYYGLVYVIGFLLVYWALKKSVKAGKLDLQPDDIESYILYLMLGVIIGARIFHVLFWNFSYFMANPLKIFFIWEGGLAFHGALVGASLVTYWFCKKNKISLMRLADIITLPVVFALALGRIANFINGELWGTATNVPWCVYFDGTEGCRHPSQIYGAIKRFAIFGFLFFLNKKEHKDGFLFWMFVGLMGLGRFILNFWREDVRNFGLSWGQYFSLVMVVIAVIVLFNYYKKDIGIKK